MKTDVTAKSIIVEYKCPYCGRTSNDNGAIVACHGKCYLATLIEAHFVDRGPEDKWDPPKLLSDFKHWSTDDRHEFARRLEYFYKKFFV